jgi:uncharacterized protein (TIGR02118 family)
MSVDVIVIYGPPADPAAFDRHYEDVHVPLAKAMPNLIGFEITRGPVAAQNGPGAHLIARLRYPSVADLEAALSSPEGVAAVDDLGNFADGGVTLYTAEVVDA